MRRLAGRKDWDPRRWVLSFELVDPQSGVPMGVRRNVRFTSEADAERWVDEQQLARYAQNVEIRHDPDFQYGATVTLYDEPPLLGVRGRKEWDPRAWKPSWDNLEDAVRSAFVEVYGQPHDPGVVTESILSSDSTRGRKLGWTDPNPNVVLVLTEFAWVQDPWGHKEDHKLWGKAMELLQEHGYENVFWDSINAAVHTVVDLPPVKFPSATMGLPPAFQRFSVGPLRFDFLRKQGILEQVRVSVAGGRDILAVRFTEPRLQPVQDVVRKILEDLYVTTLDPDRIRDLADRMDVTPEHKRFLEGMIEWGSVHRGAVMAAAAEMMPGMVRRRP